jgi:hypothetical protein
MFNQFLSITSQNSKIEIAEEDGIMIDHFRSAIDLANNDPRTTLDNANYLDQDRISGKMMLSQVDEHYVPEVALCPLT